MGTLPQTHVLSVEDYLEGELTAEVRHEYLGGEIHAMVGASDRHNLIALNLATALRPHVRGTGCQLFMADMKVRLTVAGDTVFYYPDLMLACDPEDRATYYRTRPCLIVEVLSRATQRIDRREKLLAYTAIDSFQDYILLSQDRPEAEIHRRENGWRAEHLSEGELTVACLKVRVPLQVIYDEVEFG